MNELLFQELEIETVSACNRTCTFCKYGLDRPREPVRRMPWTIIKGIVSELQVLEFAGNIAWYSTNEPLLDKRIEEIIRLTVRQLPAAFPFLITNGDLLTQRKLDSLFDAGLKALRVSCYDSETLSKVEKLDAAGLDFLWSDMRFPSIGLELFNRGGAIESSSVGVSNPFVKQSCHYPEYAIAIKADGRYKLCCGDMYADAFPIDYRFGVIGLRDYWLSKRLKLIQNTLKSSGRMGIVPCQRCDFDSSQRWPKETVWHE